MHSCDLIHADIKLQNILADFDLNEIAVTDFGISKIFRNSYSFKSTKHAGHSLRYSPLE